MMICSFRFIFLLLSAFCFLLVEISSLMPCTIDVKYFRHYGVLP
jgi:hypothetical protein